MLLEAIIILFIILENNCKGTSRHGDISMLPLNVLSQQNNTLFAGFDMMILIQSTISTIDQDTSSGKVWEVLKSSKVCGNGCLAFNGFFCCLRYHGQVCFVKPWFWKSNGFLKWLSDLSMMPVIQTAIIWTLADVGCVMVFVVSCTIENPNLFSYAVIFSHKGQAPVLRMVFAKFRSKYCNDHSLAFQALWNVLSFWSGNCGGPGSEGDP
jgi:hypothetical protein